MSHLRMRSLLCLRHSALHHPSRVASYSTKTARPFPVISDGLDNTTTEFQAAGETAAKVIEQLKVQISTCVLGGGEKGIQRHVQLNKKVLVRERLRQILDPGTPLWELCTTAGLGLEYGDVPCGGTVTGVGKIHGTDVMILANDGTVKGGTFYPITIQKQLRIQAIARKCRLPCLQVVDTGGAFLPLQSEIFLPGGRGFANQALMSSEGIDQIALVSGLCTAGGAYAPTMSDVAIITHRIGNIYLGGPPLVKAATGEIVTGEELGGATMHCSVSGITDHFAKDEQESFTITRDVMATLNLPPASSVDLTSEPPLYSPVDLQTLSGLKTLDKATILSLIARIVDGSRFLEFKQMFGGNLICGFAHLGGQLVGVVANAGPITAGDAQKGGHFVQLCDNRDIPLVFLQNSSLSVGQETDAVTMKERAKMMQCISTVRVPKVTLNVGGCVGDENYTLCGPSFDPIFYFMWPGTRILKSDPTWLAPPPPPPPRAPGTESTPAKKPRKPLSAFEFSVGSAAWAAARAICDGIVEPYNTRETLARAVQVGMLNHVPSRDSRGPYRGVVRM